MVTLARQNLWGEATVSFHIRMVLTFADTGGLRTDDRKDGYPYFRERDDLAFTRGATQCG